MTRTSSHGDSVRDLGLEQEDDARGGEQTPLPSSAAEQAMAHVLNRKEVVVGCCGRLPVLGQPVPREAGAVRCSGAWHSRRPAGSVPLSSETSCVENSSVQLEPCSEPGFSFCRACQDHPLGECVSWSCSLTSQHSGAVLCFPWGAGAIPLEPAVLTAHQGDVVKWLLLH